MSWLRYGWTRRWILRITNLFPVDSRPRNALLEFLYPSDCEITFK